MRSRRQFSTKLKLSLINLCLGLPLQPHHSRGETGQVRTGQVCRGLRQSRRWTVWPLPRLAGGPLAGGTRLTSWSTQRLQVPPAAHLCHRNLVSKKKKKHNNKKKKKRTLRWPEGNRVNGVCRRGTSVAVATAGSLPAVWKRLRRRWQRHRWTGA